MSMMSSGLITKQVRTFIFFNLFNHTFNLVRNICTFIVMNHLQSKLFLKVPL